MSTDNPHGNIIKKLCKKILFPVGIFQCGSSRVYIDDNGYFFTVIEFQPSSWSKGSYLNMGLHFLWNERNYFSFDFSCTSFRMMNYVEYHDDEQFTQAIQPYVEAALQQALFYRELRDIKTAKKYAHKWMSEYRNDPKIKNELNLINKLHNKDVLQRINRTRAYWHSKPTMKKMPYSEVYDGKTLL